MRVNSRAGVQRAAFDGAGAGEGLSIFFSQNGNASARYRVLVQAMISEGIYDVGEFYISPPLATARPGRLSRAVAMAVCPGATSWSVEISAVPDSEGAIPTETADIILASSRCCTSPVGVTRVGERYGYISGVAVTVVNLSIPAGRIVTGIAAISTGAGVVTVNGGSPITIPSGISANLAPEGDIPPNSIISFTNVDYVIEYLESA